MRWAPEESLGRCATSVIADPHQGQVVRAPMRQVPCLRRRASVCRSGSGSRLVRNGRDCRREDLAPASRRAACGILRIPEVITCHYISGTGTFELQVVAQDLDAFSRFALKHLMNLPNVKDLHTSFSLGEVKASRTLPLAHLDPKAGS